eukprot:GHRR01020845.1.p1 GENE.GHRR01020845.1~~GHRR01020845.1.p1  ORF type:complete len:381 (+),score=162.78 GHRR01020845.1:401-1543(+)
MQGDQQQQLQQHQAMAANYYPLPASQADHGQLHTSLEQRVQRFLAGLQNSNGANGVKMRDDGQQQDEDMQAAGAPLVTSQKRPQGCQDEHANKRLRISSLAEQPAAVVAAGRRHCHQQPQQPAGPFSASGAGAERMPAQGKAAPGKPMDFAMVHEASIATNATDAVTQLASCYSAATALQHAATAPVAGMARQLSAMLEGAATAAGQVKQDQQVLNLLGNIVQEQQQQHWDRSQLDALQGADNAPAFRQQQEAHDAISAPATTTSTTLDRAGSRQQRSKRMVWDAALHLRFMEAAMALGVDTATPKALLQALNDPWLSRENVASHLQKYRLALRKLAGLSTTAQLPTGQRLLDLQKQAIKQHKERSTEVYSNCSVGLSAL